MSIDSRGQAPQDYTQPMHFPPFPQYPPQIQGHYPIHFPSPYLLDPSGSGYYSPPSYLGGRPSPHQPAFPPSTWSSPPMSPVQSYYRGHGRHQSFAEESPNPAHHPPSSFQPMSSNRPWRAPERRSWSGPGSERMERKAYHPQAPANRSDWVMWVGNVPPGSSHEELWGFFNQPIPSSREPWRGPASIFLISRSSCAFVNLSCQEDLDIAVAFFNNKSLRPWDPRCPRLVCRVRRRDDDLRAGVGAQRGTGMHRDWVKQKQVEEAEHSPPQKSTHQSSASYASTNSSFLAKHFPVRVFILKSATKTELEDSVKTGTWRTQKHNEPILDQAFRTSTDVYLIFGANRTGEFFGFAKMIDYIDKERFAKSSGSSKASRPEAIVEESDDRRRASSDPVPSTLVLPLDTARIADTSPAELSPVAENVVRENKSNTDPIGSRAHKQLEARAKTQPSYFDIPEHDTQRADQIGAQKVEADTNEVDKDGVRRRDTISREDKPADLEELGQPFAIQWIKTGSLPFGRTKHLRNPWNADREVKVSRDGTEVEPNVGLQFMAEWDKLSTTVTLSSSPSAGAPTYASV
ncbi:YT521-B-like domain-domain-containing protein [Kockovaella imperatae]|uniref:YT521-B-like domain-domain-containing protein n=1 Tax=Kockovaella imperatae TaxID=4999 RepID=A0A1Y1UGJ6_9TREE|nr:YT521-B-like domain-domain-containing protein [Kockovaella imperatae]ORX37191.1 YT521-B-like domain-domain-containing protein [Kockovaella imperatae]